MSGRARQTLTWRAAGKTGTVVVGDPANRPTIEQHLAETEGPGAGRGHVALAWLGEVWTYPPVDGNAHAALYESLSAFVVASVEPAR